MIRDLVVSTAILALFFPWLSFRLNSLDMQPWIIGTNSLCLLINFRVACPKYIYAGYIFLTVIACITLMDFGENSARGFLGYYIFFTSLHVGYIVRIRYFEKFHKLFVFSNAIWLIAGLSQQLTNPYILEHFVQIRTSVGRGVTALAPEPTHYGFLLFFMSWIAYLLYKEIASRKYIVLIVLNFLFTILVAKSSMAFLMFAVLFIYICVTNGGTKKALLYSPLVIASTLFGFLLTTSGDLGRISYVMGGLLANPMDIMYSDASINQRVSHAILSVYAAFERYLLPGGFHSYADEAFSLNSLLGSFFPYVSKYNNKIMSGTGALIYELGIFGVLIIAYSFVLGSRRQYRDRHYRSALLMLWLCLFGAIPISFPLIAIVIIMINYLHYSVRISSDMFHDAHGYYKRLLV